MQRLTEFDGGKWVFKACKGCTEPQCADETRDCKEFRRQASLLAAFENIGLPPWRVAKLAQAERGIGGENA